MVRLAMYKGKGTIANAFIRKWTGSQYSHCELVIDGKWYSSSVMDGGVRCKLIELHPENWDFVELPWADSDAIVEYFKQTDYQKYGWMTLIRSQLFNRALKDNDTQFCSEWCASALGIPSSPAYSPVMLYTMCTWLTRYHRK